MEALFILVALFALMFLGFPIGIATAISTGLTIVFFTPEIPLQIIAQKAVSGLESFPLLAIPFFMYAGNLMGSGGISRRLADFAESIVGALAGGLALVTILASTFFAAISGSAPATVSAIGSIMIPEMKKRGYATSFSAAVSACAGTIGVLIPPSIPFVVYSIVAKTSIGDMFIAGIIPGLMFSAVLMGMAFVISKKRGYVGKPRELRKPLWIAFKEAIWALLAPVIILGGIYTGAFTPTEAAVVSCVYCAFIGVFVYKEMTWKDVFSAAKLAGQLNGITMYGMGFSMAFGFYLAFQTIPQYLLEQVLAITTNKILLLVALNIFFLFLGCFMDNIAATIILTPVLLPLMLKLGVDPIQFGVIMTVNLSIGFVTPPFGVNLNVASALTKVPIVTIAREAVPLILVMIIALVFITYIPWCSLGLLGLK
jgi:C4-dicarboxylate transporter DctM subunit